jgi:molybdopterin molybdotransferase
VQAFCWNACVGRGRFAYTICETPLVLNQPAPSRVVSFADASRIVREHADLLARELRTPPQVTPLLDALGLVLAEAVRADRDQPPFRRSTRDGFACRAADVNAGLSLHVVGQIRAGEASESVEIKAGEAVEIMTGAPVPAGADCVVMVEHVRHDRDTLRLTQGRSISPGDNIVPMGAEARAGEVILAAGTRIFAAQVAAAASSGAAQLRVFAPPRVAVVATGDELVEVDLKPLTNQIRNSNSYSLAAQVLAAGARPVRLAIARDERAHLEAIIRSALEADLVLISGGVSMGKYDLVEEVLLSLGAEFFFTGALIQPGKPVVFGRLALDQRKIYFFGLPGNPVSTMVTFSLFVEPLLGALAGEANRGPRFAQARLASNVNVKTGLTRFLPAMLRTVPGWDPIDVTVEPVAWQGSGDLASTSRSNCFLVVPADRGLLAAGETVSVLL